MHGSRTDDTLPVADFVDEFARALGIERAAEPVDLDAASVAYLERARREDARNRFEAVATANPSLVATDWSRPQYDPNRDAIARLTQWEPGPRGILATGPTGRGKTRALFALFARLARDEGREVRFWHAGDWFSALQQQCQYGRDDARLWVEATASRPIVILDDLGQEAVSTARADWAQAWFFRFLDIRIARGLPLLATTNLTAREISGHSDRRGIRSDPLLRRMLELAEVVKFQ